jgi:hypothetical protein
MIRLWPILRHYVGVSGMEKATTKKKHWRFQGRYLNMSIWDNLLEMYTLNMEQTTFIPGW